MDMPTETAQAELDLAAVTGEIVAAYVSNNSTQVGDLPSLIASIHASLVGLGKAQSNEQAGPEKPTAAQIRKTITPDYMVSLIDGKHYRTLKRHLTKNGLLPDDYRRKFGLPPDYPMICSNYSKVRSEMAFKLGLGQKRRKFEEPAAKAKKSRAKKAA